MGADDPKPQGRIFVGTSGWHYDHWAGPFYADGLGTEHFLEYYAQRLDSVEINNSFYQLPDAEVFATWRDAVSDDFVFAVKTSRYITHMKKLRDVREPLQRLYDRSARLDTRLGPFLFQLPPRWHFDADRLEAFTDILSGDYSHAFEFRDTTWFDEKVYDILAARNQALLRRTDPERLGGCIYGMAPSGARCLLLLRQRRSRLRRPQRLRAARDDVVLSTTSRTYRRDPSRHPEEPHKPQGSTYSGP